MQQQTSKGADLGAGGNTDWYRHEDILPFYVDEYQVYFILF